MIQRLYGEFRQLTAWADRKISTVRYIDLDIANQKRRLAGYTSGVKQVEQVSPLPSSNYCIFVYYEPDGAVSGSVRRVLHELRRQNVNVLLCVNFELSDVQNKAFSGLVHSILHRNNQGFDFGSYKDGVNFLRESGFEVDRLIFLNDSVYYISSGLREMISGLLREDDVVGLFENWGEGYHIQSFGVSVSGYVYKSRSFVDFWNEYSPINNRIFAIEFGEKRFCRAILSVARSSEVLYTASKLRSHFVRDEGASVFDNLRKFAHPWRGAIANLDKGASREFVADKVVEFINATSPVHAGAYFFPRHLKCPLFKKDLVYRGRFSFWEIENWIGEVAEGPEASELLTVLRKKGDSTGLSNTDKRKYRIGVK